MIQVTGLLIEKSLNYYNERSERDTSQLFFNLRLMKVNNRHSEYMKMTRQSKVSLKRGEKSSIWLCSTVCSLQQIS